MKRTILAACLVLLTPGLAIAQCTGKGHQDTAMSCAEGLMLDPETQTCVPLATG